MSISIIITRIQKHYPITQPVTLDLQFYCFIVTKDSGLQCLAKATNVLLYYNSKCQSGFSGISVKYIWVNTLCIHLLLYYGDKCFGGMFIFSSTIYVRYEPMGWEAINKLHIESNILPDSESKPLHCSFGYMLRVLVGRWTSGPNSSLLQLLKGFLSQSSCIELPIC